MGNIITIIAIAFLDFKDVLLIVFLRCIVVAVLSKGITVLPFSLAGGLLSAVIMWLLYKKISRLFSIKGISIVGAIAHNLAQLTVDSLILREAVMLYYLPVLLISAVITGLITGTISELTVVEIKKKGFQGCEFILLGYSAGLKDKNIEIDAGIKTSLAILLGVASSLCNNWDDVVYFALYLVIITVLLRSDLRFILKNLASYGVIFVFPYLCGLLLSLALSKLFPGATYLNNFNFAATFSKW